MIFFRNFAKKIHKGIKMGVTNEYRRELKDKIIQYAMQEFYKRGIKAVKMDEISQGLHVSKRTVYEIFGDKEELLLAGLRAQEENMRKLIEKFATQADRNVIDIICYFYRLQMEVCGQVGVLFYEEIHKSPRVVAYLRENHDRDVQDRMRFYEMGVKEGLFRGDIDYPLVSNIGQLAMNEFMHQQLYKQFSMQMLFDNYFMVIVRGICTERGLQLLDKGMEKMGES